MSVDLSATCMDADILQPVGNNLILCQDHGLDKEVQYKRWQSDWNPWCAVPRSGIVTWVDIINELSDG